MVLAPMDNAELALRWAVKRELRKRMRGVRATLPASAVVQRSAAVAGRVAALAVYREARSVAFFWPIEGRHEVDLRALIEQARGEGKRALLPATIEDGAEIGLRFFDGTLEAGPLGFEEPPAHAALASAGEVDLLIVPALVVDLQGHRVGYGRGYYDRLLPRFAPPGQVAVVAFDFQLLAEAPVTPGDVAGRWVVTDRRSFEVGASPGDVPFEGECAAEPVGEVAAVEPRAGVKVISRPGGVRWPSSDPRSSG